MGSDKKQRLHITPPAAISLNIIIMKKLRLGSAIRSLRYVFVYAGVIYVVI